MVQELDSKGMLPHETTLQSDTTSQQEVPSTSPSEIHPMENPLTIVDSVREALKTVQDPEIHMDLVTLNLIYEIKVTEGKAGIVMTFTTPMCPFGPALVEEVKKTVEAVPGISKVDVKVTFTPPWEPTPEVRMMLGI